MPPAPDPSEAWPRRSADVPILQYWHSDTPPSPIPQLLATYAERNPGRRHVVFDEPAAEALISEHFDPRHLAAFRACAVRAMQADYLRYCALLVLGGFYADADSRCIADLTSLMEGDAGAEIFERPPGTVVNSFIVVRARWHPFLELVLEIATANIENRTGDNAWLATGPGIFTALRMLHRLGSFDAFLDAYGDLLEQRLEHMRRMGTFDAFIARTTHEAVGATAKLLCRTVGDMERVREAFADVTVSPFADVKAWVRAPDVPLPYKETSAHWTNFEGSIFR